MASATGRDAAALAAIVGPGEVREAGSGDAVLGTAPALVAAPGSAEEAAALLGLASREGLVVAPRGRGTKQDRGNPPPLLDVVLETRRLDRLVEHAAGDLVVTAQAGMRLSDLQAVLAAEGQRLALDPPEDGSLGGTVAANASGPRRFRYGTARDLLIGLTVVLADGTVARAGGKVVKNVAGYDLGKLFCGSLGTLGVLVETTFRLHPLPEASRTVTVELETPAACGAALQDVLHSLLVPIAIELAWSGGGRPARLAVLFEGVAPGVEEQADRAARLLDAHGTAAAIAGSDAAALWRELGALPWAEDDAGVELRAPPADLAWLLVTLDELAGRHALEPRLVAHAGTGVARLALAGGDPEPAIRELRAALEPRGGSAVLVHGPLALRRSLEAFGPIGDALGLMQRVKEQFDPLGVLNRGRFAGGI